MKFSYIWPSGFREVVRKCGRTTDGPGGFPSFKLPQSLRPRGAKIQMTFPMKLRSQFE